MSISGDSQGAPGAASDDPQAGENTCPDCAGTGRRQDAVCATCRGSGVVIELAGDA